MLSSRVVDYLLANPHVSRAQVDDAPRMKGFFGGAVESHLLRLGHVEEATLAKALTEITGVPYAWGEHLREIPADRAPEPRFGTSSAARWMFAWRSRPH